MQATRMLPVVSKLPQLRPPPPTPATFIPDTSALTSVLALSGFSAHCALANLSHSLFARRLMAFSVGLTRFIVSSHPETAKQILNSSAFADRPIKESARELLFHRAMGFAPYGGYWRSLRRISATHLFCPRLIASFGDFRMEIAELMAKQVTVLMGKQGQVELKEIYHFGSLNNVLNCVFGKSFDFWKGEGMELERMVREGYELPAHCSVERRQGEDDLVCT